MLKHAMSHNKPIWATRRQNEPQWFTMDHSDSQWEARRYNKSYCTKMSQIWLPVNDFKKTCEKKFQFQKFNLKILRWSLCTIS